MDTMASRGVFEVLPIALLVFVLAGCGGGGGQAETGLKIPPDTRSQVTITEGIWGNVWLWKGNCMPGGSASGSVTPVVCEVLVYEPTDISSCTSSEGEPGYTAIDSKLVAATTSNATGFFQMPVPPGRYSIFIKQGGHYRTAGAASGDGCMQPVAVVSGAVTKAQLDIDDGAYF